MATVTYIKEKKQHLSAMRGVMRYCMHHTKTWDEQSQQFLISGVNCSGANSILEFETTKAAHGKLNGTNFYQYVQSFSDREDITPQQAHEVAKEFAARAWPGMEVLVTTHCDTDNVHSHFVINSVSFETGLKLRQNPNTLIDLRQISDQICQAHHLSVLPQKSKKQSKGMSAREYRAAAKGQSWKFRLINTIDDCMRFAGNREEFIALMKSEGYAVRWENSRKSITYTTPDGMKCRDIKLHEDKYLKEVMEYEFRIRKQLTAQENAAGVETDESTESAEQHGAEFTDHPYRDSVSTAGGADNADAEDGIHRAGSTCNAGVSSEPEIPHGSDNRAEHHGGDAENTGTHDFSVGTGWEEERAAYLHMVGLASGLRPDGSRQMDHTGAAHRGSTADDGVRHSDSGQQHPKPVSLKPLHAGLYGLAAAGALLDDENDEGSYRRIQAEQEAKNIGAVIGVAAGVAIAITQGKPATEEQQQAEQTQQQTM
ncbi:MAG: relaxase/mobilization nuclease domain-containing protein [Oscillibacter sp.]|nr:relaxase/mobilization nuclease domain-containing protein [Oscillibacter sp.]